LKKLSKKLSTFSLSHKKFPKIIYYMWSPLIGGPGPFFILRPKAQAEEG